MIIQLSEDKQDRQQQEDRLIACGVKWTKIGLSTEPVDMDSAIEAIKKAYKCAGLKKGPSVFLGPFDNPVECAKFQVMFKRLPEDTELKDLRTFQIPAGEEFTAEELYAAIDEQVYGCHESSWLAFYDFIKEEYNAVELEALEGLNEVAQNIGWWAPYDKVAFIQNRPEEIHLNDKGELHNENGPAIKWRGEDRLYDVYAVNGELQPPK
jgi:hypothetical protein